MELFSLKFFTRQHLVLIYHHYFKVGLHHTTLCLLFQTNYVTFKKKNWVIGTWFLVIFSLFFFLGLELESTVNIFFCYLKLFLIWVVEGIFCSTFLENDTSQVDNKVRGFT